MMIQIALAIIMSLFISACGPRKNPDLKTTYRDGQPPVVQTLPDDPEMAAAVRKAKATLDDFIGELKKPGKRQFYIKTSYPTKSGNLEFIWIESVSSASGKFRGIIGNEPLDIANLKLGDSVDVKREDVSDWMIMDGDKMLGGYTAKLLLEREKKQ